MCIYVSAPTCMYDPVQELKTRCENKANKIKVNISITICVCVSVCLYERKIIVFVLNTYRYIHRMQIFHVLRSLFHLYSRFSFLICLNMVLIYGTSHKKLKHTHTLKSARNICSFRYSIYLYTYNYTYIYISHILKNKIHD